MAPRGPGAWDDDDGAIGATAALDAALERAEVKDREVRLVKQMLASAKEELAARDDEMSALRGALDAATRPWSDGNAQGEWGTPTGPPVGDSESAAFALVERLERELHERDLAVERLGQALDEARAECARKDEAIADMATRWDRSIHELKAARDQEASQLRKRLWTLEHEELPTAARRIADLVDQLSRTRGELASEQIRAARESAESKEALAQRDAIVEESKQRCLEILANAGLQLATQGHPPGHPAGAPARLPFTSSNAATPRDANGGTSSGFLSQLLPGTPEPPEDAPEDAG